MRHVAPSACLVPTFLIPPSIVQRLFFEKPPLNRQMATAQQDNVRGLITMAQCTAAKCGRHTLENIGAFWKDWGTAQFKTPAAEVRLYSHHMARIRNSTLRLRARPSSVSLVATGMLFPYPLYFKRLMSIPFDTRKSTTALARFSDRRWL